MTPIERFFLYIEQENLNLPQLEKTYSIPVGHFNKIRSRKGGITEVTVMYVIKICPEMNLFWLFTGEGESNYKRQKASSKEIVFQENIRLKKELTEAQSAIDAILKRKGVFSDKIDELQISISNHGNRVSKLEDAVFPDGDKK